MGTELGAATVKVTLNVEDAKRQIQELRKEIQKGAPAGAGMDSSRVLKVPRPGGSTVSGDLHEDPDLGNSRGTTSASPVHSARRRPTFTVRPDGGRSMSTYGLGQLNFDSPLDFATSALNAVPGIGGALALSARFGRQAAEVGLPIAKGLARGMAETALGDNPTAKAIVESVLANIDTIAAAMLKTEAWNESIRPAIASSLEAARLAGALGTQVTPQGIVDFASQTYATEYAENLLRRKFRSFGLQNSGEAVGRGLEQMMRQSFTR